VPVYCYIMTGSQLPHTCVLYKEHRLLRASGRWVRQITRNVLSPTSILKQKLLQGKQRPTALPAFSSDLLSRFSLLPSFAPPPVLALVLLDSNSLLRTATLGTLRFDDKRASSLRYRLVLSLSRPSSSSNLPVSNCRARLDTNCIMGCTCERF